MQLTSEQLQRIRNATKDDAAFDDVLKVFEEANSSTTNNLFNLTGEQLKSIQTVIDALPIAIYIKDIECRFMLANRTTLSRHNLTSYKDLIGKTDFDLMPDELAQRYYEMEQTIYQTGKPIIDSEYCAEIRGDRRCFLISKAPIYDSNGAVIGLIGINQDITERRIARQKLQEERNLLRTVIDHIEDKIYIKDLNSRFVLLNDSTLRHQGKGMALEDIVGKTDFDFLPEDRAQMMYDEEQQIMSTGKALINLELFTPDSVTKNGDMWFLVSKVPIKDKNGIVTGLVGLNHDITAHKQAAQHKINIEVEREKSRFLQSFINDTSHEFRTPLSVIRTATYLLSKVEDISKHTKYIQQIMSQTQRIEKLIGDLNLIVSLDSSVKIGKRGFYFANILRYLKDYAEHHQPQNINLSMTFDCDSTIAMYVGDESLLGRAFERILDNALRYSDKDGTVAVQAKYQADAIVVTIKDDGIGMNDEAQKAIFQRFFRADSSRTMSGFGLGLPIAKRIIELHDGTIAVTSTPDIGSVFTITLPYADTTRNL